METEKQEQEKKISKYEFFFETPLYSFVKLEDLEDDFDDFFDGNVDAYNPNGFDTTYAIKIEELYYPLPYHQGVHLPCFRHYYGVNLTCRRKGDNLCFFIFITEDKVVKVGQNPSLADLQYAEIGKKYDKILPKQDLHDLKKAIGLSAHGAGAGALVYLRRIFENIIWKTFEDNQKEFGVSNEDFQRKRMDEKVSALVAFLPSQLVEMKGVYIILSKGIHELSEEECLAYFPALKLSIELILDQRIENKEKEQRDKSIKNELANIVKKLDRAN